MKKVRLKEKDIVKHIVDNWNNFFSELKFYKTEYKLRNFRVDIAAGFDVEDRGEENGGSIKSYHAPVFIEVKYKSRMRDLMFELQKQLKFMYYQNEILKLLGSIYVVSDKYDDTMVEFMIENNIKMFLINMDNEDINSMKLTEYTHVFSIKK